MREVTTTVARRALRPPTRFFYVLFLPDGEAAQVLDSIRLLANPDEKWRAHITVRGPYAAPLRSDRLASYNRELRGNVVTVHGVGEFVNPLPGQNTVFFLCEATRLQPVWRKPSFPGYTPHITLYNGPQADVARRLRAMAERHPFRLAFKAEKLEPMRSIKGQQRMDVTWNYVETEGPETQHIPWVEAREQPIESRLQLIEGLFARLSSLSMSARGARP